MHTVGKIKVDGVGIWGSGVPMSQFSLLVLYVK